MRLPLLIVFSGLLFVGCKNKNRIPNDILPREKMQAVLWDMIRADQFLTSYVLTGDSSKDKTAESIKFYQQVLSIHQVEKEEFQNSLSYYQSHPELLKDIMDSLSRPKKAVPTDITSPVPVDAVSPGEERLIQPDTAVNPLRKKKKAPATRL